jgi:hypothetical protein
MKTSLPSQRRSSGSWRRLWYARRMASINASIRVADLIVTSLAANTNDFAELNSISARAFASATLDASFEVSPFA